MKQISVEVLCITCKRLLQRWETEANVYPLLVELINSFPECKDHRWQLTTIQEREALEINVNPPDPTALKWLHDNGRALKITSSPNSITFRVVPESE